MPGYYTSTKKNPYHLSVGAVVLDKQNRVLCHHFSAITISGETFKDLYSLVRETLEPEETLEGAVHRGLLEETGVKVNIRSYIGSMVSEFPRGGQNDAKNNALFPL